MPAHGKGYAVLGQPFLVFAVKRGVMCDLVQPPDAEKDIRVVCEVPDVSGDPRGRSIEFVHTRPLNHIP